MGDAFAGAICNEAAEGFEPIAQDRRPTQESLDLADGVVARRLGAQGLVFLGARNDLGVEAGELLHEAQVFGGEGVRARRVVHVQHPEDLPGVDQGDAEGGLDVDPLADEVVGLPVGPAAQVDRVTLGRDPSGDTLAEADADLVPELGLDAAARRESAGSRFAGRGASGCRPRPP